MAQCAGRDVVYSASQYSELQPIETVWALTKGNAGREFSSETKLPDVLARLWKAFAELQPRTVKSCINKANRNFAELQVIVQKQKAVESLEMDDDGEKKPTGGCDLEGFGDSCRKSEVTVKD